MNELLMTYLQSVLGVDSVARFLAFYSHRSDGFEAANHLFALESQTRTGNLQVLCDDAEMSLAETQKEEEKQREEL